MNRFRWIAAALALSVSTASAQSRPTRALAWLSGCWQRTAGSTVMEEQWQSPRGGMLLGMSRVVRGDSVLAYETVRIYEAGDTLVYAARPSRQEPAEFRALEPSGDEIVFVNAAHDFPQRIRYRRIGADSMHARIEGTLNGRERAVDFPYRRVVCGPPAP